MPTPLPKYVQICNNYCIGYFGDDDNIILDLKRVRPTIESSLPGMVIFLCCNDSKMELLSGEINVFPRSELYNKLKEVAYVRELTPDADYNVVEELLKESGISCPKK
jgi:hypothetical protein